MLRPAHSTVAIVLLALSSLAFAPSAGAAPGQLDPSFGSGGQVRLLPSRENIALRGVATQPDGKIVLAGADLNTGATLVVRLLENGAFDPNFGASGIVSLALGEGSEGRAVLVQPDGKIVIAGTAKGPVKYDFMFARLNSDGSPDLSFGGGDGSELLSLGAVQDRAETVALGPGGRIIATGESRLPGNDVAAAVAVLGSNGLPDPGYFGGDGIHTISTAFKQDRGEAAAILGDGRVLIAISSGMNKGFTLMQLQATGTPDPLFGGGDGVVEAPVPSAGTEKSLGGRISDFQLLADGRIVASGNGYDAVGNPPKSDSKAAVARFLPDGQLDESFGSAGFFTQQFGPGLEYVEDVEVAPTGKLVVAGPYLASSEPVTSEGRAVARLEPGGAPDPTFGPGGFVLSGVTAPFGEVFDDAALDPQERLVYVGRAFIGNNNTEVVITRYLGDIEPQGPNLAPHARMKKVPKKVKATKLKAFAGTASDPDGAIARVQIAVTKAGKKCVRMTNAKAKFKPAKKVGPKGKKRCEPRWLTAKGKAKWSFKLKKSLAPGRYVVIARAVDSEGLAESAFTRKAGNRYAFRVLADR